MKTNFNLLFIIALLAILVQGCVPSPDVNINIKNDSLLIDTTISSANMVKHSIETRKANYIVAKIIFPAGKIRIEPCKTNLMNGSFKFTNNDWKPKISYTETGDTGKITIEPKKRIDNVNFNDSDTCRWFIDLNPEKKYDIDMQIGACKGYLNFEGFMIQNFNIELGAGKININLKNTSVPNVEISVGAGKATVDLTGTWNNNLKANIAGGVGEIEIHLPKDVGVKAEVNGLLGRVDAEGFTKRHNTYSNSNLEKTKYILDLNIDGAIGKVKLVLE
ncbi:MAG: hypothetical protein COS14_06710 [Bacteroidetes bacterium CG02_land_8_20_14_3_00_31_25]|nr:MAG: hypothetical protein COS14_06710 [Bacteroidetes bacterium CG02_land_8_20_14_3_00_31_25]